jgi:CRP-like cAMP-binding protein
MRALPDNAERTLRAFRPFADLSAGALADLWAGARAQRLPRGARLFRVGQPVNEIFLLGRGLVSVHQAGDAQGKLVVDFGGPGDVLGLAEGAPTFAYRASATVASHQAHVIAIGASEFAAVLRREPALGRALAGAAGSLESKLRVVAAGTASARLATTLLALASRYGRVGALGEIVLPFAPPVAELAAFAGVPRALAARTIDRWSTQELVFVYDEALVIEAPWALESLAKGERDEAPRSGAVAAQGFRLEPTTAWPALALAG